MQNSKIKLLMKVGILSLPLLAGEIIIEPNVAQATIKETPKSEPNQRNSGEGYTEFERQKKFAKQLQTSRGPQRLRTNILASMGLAVGAAIGEVATTIVTCISKCFGVDTGYKPGDLFRQGVDGQRLLWGLKRSSGNRTRSATLVSPKPKETRKVTRKYGYEAEWTRHKYGFDYFPSRFGGFRVGTGDKTIHVKLGSSIKVGNKTLTAAIDPTGKRYFKE